MIDCLNVDPQPILIIDLVLGFKFDIAGPNLNFFFDSKHDRIVARDQELQLDGRA